MTFGPNNPGAPDQFPVGGPMPAAAPGASQALLAPTGPTTQRRLIAGIVALVAAILLFVGSFLSWATMSETESEFGITATMSETVSGMGNATLSAEISGAPSGLGDIIDSAAMSEAEDKFEEETTAAGIWTIIFGVIVAAGAVLLLIRRYPGIGALVTAVGGVAAFIASMVFIADPIGAVTTSKADTSGDDFSAGAGLWLVVVGAVLALIAGAAMVLLTAMPGRFDDAAPAPGGFGGPLPGQPQQFPGQQFPGQPQQFPGQQFPGQQHPGQPQQFPGQAPQQHPGQQFPGQPPQQFPGQPGQPG